MFLEEMVSSASFELSPEVVRAGAGTGKTTWLIDKVFRFSIAFEKRYGYKPRLAVCTFTRKAAYELKERLTLKALESGKQDFLEYINSPKLFISTLHGLFYSFLKSYGWRDEINPDFHIISDAEEMKIINTLAASFLFNKYLYLLKQIPFYHLTNILKIYTRERLKYGSIAFYNKKDFKDFVKESHSLQKSTAKALAAKRLFKDSKILEDSYFIPFFQEFQKLAEEFFPLFLNQKKRMGELTPDDLELLLLNLIKKNGQACKFIAKDRNHWLIDEYQDTSQVQEQIIKKIAQFNNVSCVGDPGQSIYLFRNADPEVFDRRIKEYDKEPTHLTLNYRSATSLICFFNDFFSSKSGFLKLEPPTKLSLENPKLSLEVPCVYFISYSPKDSSEVVFKKILNHIQRLIFMGDSYGDIAVLSTKNEDLTALALFLEKQHIPILIQSAEGFLKNRILLDCLFLYKFLINPYDTENLIALYRTPYFRISDETLSGITGNFFQKKDLDTLSRKNEDKNFKNNLFNKKSSSFWEYCLKNFSQEEPVKNLKTYLKLKEDLGLLPAFEEVLFEQILPSINPSIDFTGTCEASIWKLLKHLYNRRASQYHPLDFYYSFMEENLNNEEAQEAPISSGSSAVRLLTIHGSKGLEFKNIVVFNLSKTFSFSKKEAVYDSKKKKLTFSVPFGGRNQSKIKCYGHKKINKKKNEKELKEADRQLYVAMTRAKNSLCLFVPEGKFLKNSWFERFSFFDSFRRKTENGFWEIKEGFYKRENYSFLVERNIKEQKIHKVLPSSSSSKVLWNMKTKQKTKNPIKSSRDFILSSVANNKRSSNEKPLLPLSHPIKEVHSFIKAQQGTQLHYYLHLLCQQSDSRVLKRIETSFLSSEEKLELKRALNYTMNLKHPPLSLFLKKGFPEWSFKLKQGSFVLQGQIDLWGWQSEHIYLFDYKSSNTNKTLVKKQLAFYSYVLEKLYNPKDIKCFAIYPFQKQTEEYSYSLREKKEMSLWLKSL